MLRTDETDLEIPCELASRSADQIDVALLWWERGDRLAVSVVDRKSNAAFVLDVGGRDPLEVFTHPYVYAPTASGVPA